MVRLTSSAAPHSARFLRAPQRGGRVCLLGIAVLVITGGITLLRADNLSGAATRSVGAAEVDITPDYPVRLSGYGNRREPTAEIGIHLFAKALAIGTDREGPAVLLTVDNVGVPGSVRAEVLRRLMKDTKVTSDRFALSFTHTHCAPMLTGVLPNLFGMDIPPEQIAATERYTRELTLKLEQVARAALANRKASNLAWGVGDVTIAANRRRTPIQPVDHDFPVLRVTDAANDETVRAIFLSYACHCTTIGLNVIHGDWAGCAQAKLESDFPGAIALVSLGCGGDQNPEPRGTLRLVQQHGEDMASIAGRMVKYEPFKPITGTLECHTKLIYLPYATLPSKEGWDMLAQSKTPAIAYHAKKNLERLEKGEPLPTTLPYMVQVWTFGRDLAMIFLPGEVVVDYSLRLKTEFDHARVWVNAYTNDAPCYIPSRRVLDEGGYEGGGSMVYYDKPTKFAPDVEARIIRAVHDLMPKEYLALPAADNTSAPHPAKK